MKAVAFMWWLGFCVAVHVSIELDNDAIKRLTPIQKMLYLCAILMWPMVYPLWGVSKFMGMKADTKQ